MLKRIVVLVLFVLFTAAVASADQVPVYTQININPVNPDFQPNSKLHNLFVPEERAEAWIEEAGGHWVHREVLANMAIAVPKGAVDLTSRTAGNKVVACGNGIAYIRVPRGKFIELNPPASAIVPPPPAPKRCADSKATNFGQDGDCVYPLPAPAVCPVPIVALEEVKKPGRHAATLKATVDGMGRATNYTLKYGDDKVATSGSATGFQRVSKKVKDLESNTDYPYEIVGQSECGITRARGTFTTKDTWVCAKGGWRTGVCIGGGLTGLVGGVVLLNQGGCNSCPAPVDRDHSRTAGVTTFAIVIPERPQDGAGGPDGPGMLDATELRPARLPGTRSTRITTAGIDRAARSTSASMSTTSTATTATATASAPVPDARNTRARDLGVGFGVGNADGNRTYAFSVRFTFGR